MGKLEAFLLHVCCHVLTICICKQIEMYGGLVKAFFWSIP